MAINNIVLDFDGTCTQIPFIYEAYLKTYRVELNNRFLTKHPVSEDNWKIAQQIIRDNSPKAAWTLSDTPAAPAGADPYILAFETAMWLARNNNMELKPPFEVHSISNESNPAPWRLEAKMVFERLLNENIRLFFISNSSSTKITNRLIDLLGITKLPPQIKVQSDASKFRIHELTVNSEIPDNNKKLFENLPVTHQSIDIGRPIHLRRGFYFEAINAVLGTEIDKLENTVFCGDIWEMDLAMPQALGAKIHLIERASPFETYSYEREAVDAVKGKISENLTGLLSWL